VSKRILHSRPRAEADWECPRRRYWLYEFDGRGLNAEVESFEQYFGTTQHDGLAAIATFWKRDGKVDIDLIASTAQQQMYQHLIKNGEGTDEQVENFASEQAALTEGLLRGFYKHVWPRLIEKYAKILAIEADVSFIHDEEGLDNKEGDFEFMAKPDLVLSTEDESEIVYIEYKSTSSKKEKWINSWDRSVQVHATREAIKQTLGYDCTGVIVQGLYKGYESYGKLSTPLAYAYHRWGNPPFTKTETLYEYKPGYKKYPTWQLEGGVKQWVDGMPEEVLMEQFPCTPLIFPDPDNTTRFFRQRALREKEIKLASAALTEPEMSPGMRQYLLDKHFDQRNNKCKPAWGFECPMQHLCFGQINDPLKAGMTYRNPHHQTEIDQQEAE
jgi:hypothetical protein